VEKVGNLLRKNGEDRRQFLIDQLLAFNIYKKEDKHLFELSLSELEEEYSKFQSHNHPHGSYGSIKWSKKRFK
jgi:hypothetical protein